jgi:hypothetical protein
MTCSRDARTCRGIQLSLYPVLPRPLPSAHLPPRVLRTAGHDAGRDAVVPVAVVALTDVLGADGAGHLGQEPTHHQGDHASDIQPLVAGSCYLPPFGAGWAPTQSRRMGFVRPMHCAFPHACFTPCAHALLCMQLTIMSVLLISHLLLLSASSTSHQPTMFHYLEGPASGPPNQQLYSHKLAHVIIP